MIKPISPDEIAEAKKKAIPEYVFEIVNDILARKFTAGSCIITQSELISAITSIGELSRSEVFERGYLNFEEAYRDAGWRVVYDKPGYNENYNAFFNFSRK